MTQRLGAAVAVLVSILGSADARSASAAASAVRLVWYVEAPDGQVVEALDGDEPINPASVVKVATTLRALATLGPDHRFATRFRVTGVLDPSSGTLDGDLVVEGGADPDFHVENAFLVAAELNRAGLHRVSGTLAVDERFWIGWEGGSASKPTTPDERAARMAARLRRALDPSLWDRATRRAWNEHARRLGLDVRRPPAIAVARTRVAPSGEAGTVLVTHRSNPLVVLLRRFNAWSNNDIERLDATLGPAATLGPWLAERLGVPQDAVQLATSSGLGTNRLTPRLVVALLRALAGEAERRGLALDEILAVAGCDRGTVTRLYPVVSRTPGVLVGKTGTLTHTDGGVSVLAGILHTDRGDLTFCVAAPGVAGRIDAARRATERFLLDRLAVYGSRSGEPCAAPPAGPADHVELLREQSTDVLPTRADSARVGR